MNLHNFLLIKYARKLQTQQLAKYVAKLLISIPTLKYNNNFSFYRKQALDSFMQFNNIQGNLLLKPVDLEC